jgi:hypothetical protein
MIQAALKGIVVVNRANQPRIAPPFKLIDNLSLNFKVEVPPFSFLQLPDPLFTLICYHKAFKIVELALETELDRTVPKPFFSSIHLEMQTKLWNQCRPFLFFVCRFQRLWDKTLSECPWIVE